MHEDSLYFCHEAERAQQRVLAGDAADQLTNLFVDRRTADRRFRFPSPIEAEAFPMPFDDSVGKTEFLPGTGVGIMIQSSASRTRLISNLLSGNSLINQGSQTKSFGAITDP